MMELVKDGQTTENPIDTAAVVRHLGGHTTNDFDKKRCEKEFDRMIDHVEAIRNEPIYRWPK